MSARLLLLVLILPVAVQAGPVIQHWQTGNGAHVYFVAAPELPMVDLRVVFDAGSARDGQACSSAEPAGCAGVAGADKYGVAALTNGLLSDGATMATGELTADQIAEQFAKLGAQFGTGTDLDTSSVSLRSLTDPVVLRPAAELVAALLGAPSFPQNDFERQRKGMLTGLQAQQQSPDSIAGKAFYQAIYGTHPYARQTLGTVESLNQLTREDAVNHHARYYVAHNATVAIVGALDRAAAETLAETVVGGLPQGAKPAPLPKVAELATPISIELSHPSTQTHVLVGQPGITRDDPDYFPLLIGNHILGGNGLVSRLNDEIREKRGLSYSAYSYFQPLRDKGAYTLGLQTRNEQTANALQVLRDTLQKFVASGPTPQELKAAKQNITGGFALRIDSNSKLIDYLALIGFYGLPLDFLDNYTKRVEQVSLEQIKDAFKRRIKPEQMVTVVVGGGIENKPSEPGTP